MTGRALDIGGTTASSRSRLRGGIWLGALGVLCFSGTAPATRIAAPVFGAGVLTWSRIMVAACLGAIALAATRQLRWPGRKWFPGLIAAGLGQAVGYPLFLALAVERVPAYHGAVVIGLTPAATAVLAALRGKERPRPRFWIACGIGFAAVLTFAVGQGGGSLQTADGWLVAAILSTAVGYVEGARVSRAIGAVPTLCWAMILLSPVATIALAVLVPTHHFGPLTAPAWISFGYVGVASMFLGSIVWFAALAVGGTARIGQLNLVQPFLAISWSALLLSERLTWAVPATATVVLASMAVCINTGTRSSPDQHPRNASKRPHWL
jgi:drug/metabolite transporter (DMT)-like permease